MEVRALLGHDGGTGPHARSRRGPGCGGTGGSKGVSHAVRPLLRAILGYVRLRIRDASTCEDVASTVFTTALGQLARFRGDGPFAAWLFQIARNAVRDVQRKPPGRCRFPTRWTASEPGAEERFLAYERAAELHALIRLLPREQQHSAGAALRRGPGIRRDRSDRRRRARNGARAHAPDTRTPTTEVSR